MILASSFIQVKNYTYEYDKPLIFDKVFLRVWVSGHFHETYGSFKIGLKKSGLYLKGLIYLHYDAEQCRKSIG